MYSVTCNSKNAFMTNPPQQCVGYVTDFNGLGMSAALAKDLTVYCPALTPVYTPIGVPVTNKVNVTAVLESFSWTGNKMDALSFNCLMSTQNTNQLRMVQQTGLKNTSISALGWWVVNYDMQRQQWFEMDYPTAPEKPGGHLLTQGSNVNLSIGSTPVAIAQGINVYNISFQILPPNQMVDILWATSSTTKVMLAWGMLT